MCSFLVSVLVAANTVNNVHIDNDKRFHDEAYESDFINSYYKRLNILYQGLRFSKVSATKNCWLRPVDPVFHTAELVEGLKVDNKNVFKACFF